MSSFQSQLWYCNRHKFYLFLLINNQELFSVLKIVSRVRLVGAMYIKTDVIYFLSFNDLNAIWEWKVFLLELKCSCTSNLMTWNKFDFHGNAQVWTLENAVLLIILNMMFLKFNTFKSFFLITPVTEGFKESWIPFLQSFCWFTIAQVSNVLLGWSKWNLCLSHDVYLRSIIFSLVTLS